MHPVGIAILKETLEQIIQTYQHNSHYYHKNEHDLNVTGTFL
jgi:hypothetical protein